MGLLATDQTVYTTLATESCYKCGVVFAMTREFKEQRRKDRQSFFCPNGHSQHYTRDLLDAARTEAAQVQARNDQLQAALRTERARVTKTQNQLSATKGVVTRLKNRAKNGVCPCCNRTFQQLARHMATKHPGFDPATC